MKTLRKTGKAPLALVNRPKMTDFRQRMIRAYFELRDAVKKEMENPIPNRIGPEMVLSYCQLHGIKNREFFSRLVSRLDDIYVGNRLKSIKGK